MIFNGAENLVYTLSKFMIGISTEKMPYNLYACTCIIDDGTQLFAGLKMNKKKNRTLLDKATTNTSNLQKCDVINFHFFFYGSYCF